MFKKMVLGVVITGLAACGDGDVNAEKEILIPAAPPVTVTVGGHVTITSVATEQSNWSDPSNQQWNTVQQHSVDMSMAPPVHQSVNLRYDPTTPMQPMHFRVATDNKNLFIQLQWEDATKNTVNEFEKFSDGAAVQFALNGGAMTSFMMGAPNGAVNIWYWKAGVERAQNLAAGGFGSTQPLAQQNVAASSVYKDGRWTVVFSRPIVTEGEHHANLAAGQDIYMAFAQWQGEKKQRDGLKRVTMGWVIANTASPAPTDEVASH